MPDYIAGPESSRFLDLADVKLIWLGQDSPDFLVLLESVFRIHQQSDLWIIEIAFIHSDFLDLLMSRLLNCAVDPRSSRTSSSTKYLRIVLLVLGLKVNSYGKIASFYWVEETLFCWLYLISSIDDCSLKKNGKKVQQIEALPIFNLLPWSQLIDGLLTKKLRSLIIR